MLVIWTTSFVSTDGSDHTFRDYKVFHSDLEIEIVDEEATFYEAEEGHDARLDHSPRTLGREE